MRKWNGWGWVDRGFDLHGHDDAFWSFVAQSLGRESLPSTPSLPLAAIPLPEVRVTEAVIEALRAALDVDRVCTDHEERVFHAVGKSYHDLIRLRAGKLADAPDVVVYPRDAEEVARVLEIAQTHRLAVVPFGGGSSVVGGVEATKPASFAGVLTLDTTQMDAVIDVDPESLTATVQAGIFGPELESRLQSAGYTVGHFPQSFEFSTLGGWIAARSSGQQSNKYGSFEKILVSARVVTPTGEIRTLTVPRSAAGPNLNELIAGSEGTLGVIVDATIRVHPVPRSRDIQGVLFPTFDAGATAIRRIVQAGIPVAMMRLSDADETRFYSTFASLGKAKGPARQLLGRALGATGYREAPAMMLLGMEGEPGEVRSSKRRALAIALAERGIPLGGLPGRKWYEGRFDMPYLRDPMLDRGVGVDTLETSTVWSKIGEVHREVRESLLTAMRHHGGAGFVMAHISHSYPHGASLYFTFVFPRQLDQEVDQWLGLKRAASDAIARCGATISHHHGVGTDHVPWYAADVSDAGSAMVRAARQGVDPLGIMNPGKLFSV